MVVAYGVGAAFDKGSGAGRTPPHGAGWRKDQIVPSSRVPREVGSLSTTLSVLHFFGEKTQLIPKEPVTPSRKGFCVGQPPIVGQKKAGFVKENWI